MKVKELGLGLGRGSLTRASEASSAAGDYTKKKVGEGWVNLGVGFPTPPKFRLLIDSSGPLYSSYDKVQAAMARNYGRIHRVKRI